MRRSLRIALALAAIVGILVAGAIVFQRELGTWALGRVVASRVGRDNTATLPDGLHIVFCGTGSPLPDPSRAEACNLVIAGKHMFVVDAGDGGPRKLGQLGVPMGRIDGVFLTHFHSDHFDGLGTLMLLRWTAGTHTRPLPIHGPPGVEQVVAGFNTAYGLDNGYRVAHHGPRIVPPGGAGGVAMPFAVADKPVVVFDADGVRITAFPVNHSPVTPAVGYRFDYKGRSLVLSGDTAASPSLVAAAKGADLLIHEALQPKLGAIITDALAARGQANVAQITRDIRGYHATPEEAADAAKGAGVRQLVLSHIVPPVPLAFAYPAFLGDAPKHFEGPITIAEDGMVFSLPAGGTAIIRESFNP
ncbi:ribonuclease Z [alpha proteobacterium AAP81b]|nr:ribonuclease Z [alpha proteobacterium AAP81b]